MHYKIKNMEYSCKKCDLKFTKKGLDSHYSNCKFTSIIVENIIIDYKDNFLSYTKLASKYRINKNLLSVILKEVTRTRSEAGKIRSKLEPRTHTEESKQKIRESRLKYMKENPDNTAWRQKNISYPEKLFLNYLNLNKYNDRFLIEREKSVFPFFIDFAFLHEKIAVEIDGSQHNNPDVRDKDRRKDSLLKENGWLVVRVTAQEVIKNTKGVFDILDDILKNRGSSNEKVSFGIFKKPSSGYIKKERGEDGRTNAEREKSFLQRVVERPCVEVLKKSVGEIGYKATGRKYNVSDNTIRNWIK